MTERPQFNCGFLREKEEDDGARGRSDQPPNFRPRLAGWRTREGPKFIQNQVHQIENEFEGLRDNAQAEGTLFGRGYERPGGSSELDRGSPPFLEGGGSVPETPVSS